MKNFARRWSSRGRRRAGESGKQGVGETPTPLRQGRVKQTTETVTASSAQTRRTWFSASVQALALSTAHIPLTVVAT